MPLSSCCICRRGLLLQEGTWAGHMELQAASLLLQVRRLAQGHSRHLQLAQQRSWALVADARPQQLVCCLCVGVGCCLAAESWPSGLPAVTSCVCVCPAAGQHRGFPGGPAALVHHQLPAR